MTTHSPELNQLAAALASAQAELTAIPKDSQNPFLKSKYAGLPKVVEVASPIITKHGLSVAQFLGIDEQGDTLTTWLLHKSGQFIAESMRLYSEAARGLSRAQAQGSATTYARRYAYMAALGLVADEDTDGNLPSKSVIVDDFKEKLDAIEVASLEDIKEIRALADRLPNEKKQLIFTKLGLPRSYSQIPKDKVIPLIQELGKAVG